MWRRSRACFYVPSVRTENFPIDWRTHSEKKKLNKHRQKYRRSLKIAKRKPAWFACWCSLGATCLCWYDFFIIDFTHKARDTESNRQNNSETDTHTETHCARAVQSDAAASLYVLFMWASSMLDKCIDVDDDVDDDDEKERDGRQTRDRLCRCVTSTCCALSRKPSWSRFCSRKHI